MRRVNQVTVCKKDYKSEEEFRNAIKDAIMVLLDNNYIMTVRYDEKGCGIVAIDFDYDKQEFGGAYPYWLFPEEYESISWNDEKENEE